MTTFEDVRTAAARVEALRDELAAAEQLRNTLAVRLYQERARTADPIRQASVARLARISQQRVSQLLAQ